MMQRRRLLVCFLLLTLPSILGLAADSENVLIRNVVLIDQSGEADDVIVNLVVKNKRLKVVTKDDVDPAEGMLVLDAENGVLLGELHLGEAPSFLIFSEDPRENVEVLLDTATHARFVVHKGVIVKNTLLKATDVKPATVPWLAHTPPPRSLPLSYQDRSEWNKWKGRRVSGMFFAAVVLDRQRWVSQDAASKRQVGSVDEFDGGTIRGLRFGSVGTLNFSRPWVYTIFAMTNAFDRGFDSDTDEDLEFLDYRLDIPLGGGINLSIGKQKEPISMERIMSLVQLPLQERASLLDAVLPSRNVGVVVSGAGNDERFTWAAGLFNDAIDHGESLGENSTQLIGRTTWLPFVSNDRSNLFHLGLGLRYSDVKEGGRFLAVPEFPNSPSFADTGFLTGDRALTWDLEASWRWGPRWLGGEYVRVDVDVDSASSGDLNFSGYHVTGSWILSGEMRPYEGKRGILGPVPVARPVNQGGPGAWELASRWSSLDLSDGVVDGGKMDIASLGINWWLTSTAGFRVDYRHVRLDRSGMQGDAGGLSFRLVLLLD